MLQELCKRIQHCCASLRRSRSKRNVGSCWLETLTGFKLWATTSNNRAEQRRRMCRDGRGLGSKLVSFAKGFSKHPLVLAIFKVDSEYLRFPFKVMVGYFILYSSLVCNFSSTFFYEQKETHERSVPAMIVSFAKGFSKRPHIFPIFMVVSEHSRFPLKLMVDYFLLYSILLSTFVMFLLLFSMNKRRCTDKA